MVEWAAGTCGRCMCRGSGVCEDGWCKLVPIDRYFVNDPVMGRNVHIPSSRLAV
jgi:hypothetical protein